MNDSKVRLGTFRIPENTWKDFVAKARSNDDNASSILLNTVHAYLNSEVNSSASPNSSAIAISPTPTNPSSNTPSTHAHAIASSANPTPSPHSSLSILLAIAPDNQILYIDRGIPQDWNPPYHLRNTNIDYRLEFLTASDSSILLPVEDTLVKTFKPPFNFKTKTKTNLNGHIDVDEPLQSTTAASIPLHLSDRIHALLSNGLSPEDIHHALNSLHLHSKKSEPDRNPNPNTEQINSAIASLTKITNRISTIEENLIQLQLTTSQKLTTTTATTQANTDTTDKDQTKPKSSTVLTEKHIQAPSTSNPKPLPLPLKGTASVKELPTPLGTTELAQRLNISVKRLEKVRSQYKNSTEGFFKYTLNKENDKFGWIYDPTQRLHIPYLEVPTAINSAPATPKEMQTLANPSDIKEKSESTPPKLPPKLNPDKSITKSKSTKKPKPKPLPNLNQSQLANRFGVNPSTLSRKRTSFSDGYISAQDFDSWCRTKDPDNFTWTFSEDSKDYTCQP